MPPIFLLFVAIVIAIGIASWLASQKRRDDIAELASRLHLQYSADDPFDLVERPFELFRRGDGRGCESVMWGSVGDHRVTAFDYWYYEEHTDAQGHSSRNYSRYSCCLLESPVNAPHLVITPESFLTRIADRIGLKDIEFEWEEFNRAWQVKSKDRKFAFTLIDPKMMEWLSSIKGWSFELNGLEILCFSDKLTVEQIPILIDTAKSFSSVVPSVAKSLYPPERASA